MNHTPDERRCPRAAVSRARFNVAETAGSGVLLGCGGVESRHARRTWSRNGTQAVAPSPRALKVARPPGPSLCKTPAGGNTVSRSSARPTAQPFTQERPARARVFQRAGRGGMKDE